MSYKKWCEAVILIVSTLWCHLVYIRPWCYTHFVYLHRSVMVRLWQLLLEVPSIIIHKQVGTHMKNIPRELFFHSCTMNEPCNVCHWVTLTSLICNNQGNSMLALPTNSLQTWPHDLVQTCSTAPAWKHTEVLTSWGVWCERLEW